MQYKMEELLPIIEKLIDKYTGKESSSVTYEIAQRLMGAAIYCINEIDTNQKENGLLTYPIIQTLKMSASDAYQAGYHIAVGKFIKANQQYMKIMDDFDGYENIAYIETVVKGLSAFFKYYDVLLYPQNHIITLDYPVLEDLSTNQGIDLIERYINCIELEQTFLNRLHDESIRTVLASYHNGYEELLINIPSIVLRKIIMCMMIGKKSFDEPFDYEELNQIKKVVSVVQREQLECEMEKVLFTIIQNKYQANEALYKYLSRDISDFACELINAVGHNHLENIF